MRRRKGPVSSCDRELEWFLTAMRSWRALMERWQLGITVADFVVLVFL